MNLFRFFCFCFLAIIFFNSTTFAQTKPTRLQDDEKPGSLLIYNIYTSKSESPESQNTRVNITNLGTDSVNVHWFFIDSMECNVADAFTCLTANQTLSFFALDYDPGVTGYIIALATDNEGLPRDYNYLVGSESVKFSSGHQANLGAESIGVITQPIKYYPVPDTGFTMVDIAFDDDSYERLPFELALDSISSLRDNNETMLIVNRIGGDLGNRLGNVGSLTGLLFNDVEKGFSFSMRTSGCQVRQILTDAFPRTAPPFSKVIPTGKTGWMWIRPVDTDDNSPLGGTSDRRAILGSMISYNRNARNSDRSFNQGHNLHKLSKTPFAKLRVPVYVPPSC